jgi:hypothetical protein
MNPRLLRVALAALAVCGAAAPAAADASSIVYVSGDQVWLSTPDGARQVQVTRDGGYTSASQADDGTIVALRSDNQLYRFDQRGALRNPPVPLWLGAGNGTYTGPFSPHVSPDGSKVAYAFARRTTVCDPIGCTGSTALGGAYTWADRYTEPNELGKLRDWTNPSWLASGATLMFSPGSGSISASTPNVIQHLPGQPGADDDDVEHATAFFDDPDAAYIQFGALTRDGATFAAAEGTPPGAPRIRLYHVDGVPAPGWVPEVAFRCELTGPPGGRYGSLSWAPDGSALAYEAGGSMYVVSVGDLSASCDGKLGAPRRLGAGLEPSWGPKDVAADAGAPPDPGPGPNPVAGGKLTVRALPGQRLRRALAKGLRVRVNMPAAGRVTATGFAGKRRVARGKAAARAAGRVTVRLRFSARARAALRHRRSVKLSVRVTAGALRARQGVKLR